MKKMNNMKINKGIRERLFGVTLVKRELQEIRILFLQNKTDYNYTLKTLFSLAPLVIKKPPIPRPYYIIFQAYRFCYIKVHEVRTKGYKENTLFYNTLCPFVRLCGKEFWLFGVVSNKANIRIRFLLYQFWI